jgi:hypothetical protein
MGEVIEMTDHLHGLWGYRRYECRCDVCCTAHTEHNAKRRKHRAPAVLIDPEPLIEFIMKTDDRLAGSLMHSINRWRANGVDLFIADKHCIRRGAHPAQIYGDDWWHFGHEEMLESV